MDEEQDRPAVRWRWIKVAVIVLALAALGVVAAMMAAGGQHGPARHFSLWSQSFLEGTP